MGNATLIARISGGYMRPVLEDLFFYILDFGQSVALLDEFDI